jgi:hypothetical protein
MRNPLLFSCTGLHQMSHQSSIEKLTKQHVVVNKELEMIDIKEKKTK